jgi:hypothetical protein
MTPRRDGKYYGGDQVAIYYVAGAARGTSPLTFALSTNLQNPKSERMNGQHHESSPDRRSLSSLSSLISAMRAKINRAMSTDSETGTHYDPETESIASTVLERAGERHFYASSNSWWWFGRRDKSPS